ncbi:MAG: tetratricopeptide repeat protein [Deltaproteobacteria bacterium]|nr:tetratricopeptide repeat protein [Deltaproteobacteria bacterium]
MAADVYRCPSCYLKLSRTDFQCPRCELILEGRFGDPAPAPKEVSIVRAIMERPQGTVSRKRPLPPSEPITDPDLAAKTMEYTIPRPLNEVLPRVVVGLTVNALSLTPFEAFVVSNIDGKTPGHQLKALLDLSEVELQAVLRSLETRGAIALEPVPQRPVSAAKNVKAKPPPPPPQTQPKVKLMPVASMPAAPPERPSPTSRAKGKPGLELPAPASVSDGAPMPKQSDARIKLGEGVARNKKVLDALKHVRKSTAPSEPRPESAPQSATDIAAEGALQVAIRMEQDGRMDEAIRYLERSIAHSPDAAPLLNRLAIVLVRDRRDFRESERLLRRAL